MNARPTVLNTTIFIFFFATIFLIPEPLFCEANSEGQESVEVQDDPVIAEIIVKGNKHISTDAILQRLPYKIGQTFDPTSSSQAIQLIYSLGYFRQIQLELEEIAGNKIKLFVLLQEKKLLDKIQIEGNKALNKKKLLAHINAEKITSMDEETAAHIVRALKKLYAEENYHHVSISSSLFVRKNDPDKVVLKLAIKEGPKSAVTRVYFKGNNHIPDRKLSNFIFTREQWLLGVLSDAGKLDMEQLEMDKHRLEYFYRDHGYLTARVVDVDVVYAKKKNEVHITFEIREGSQYTINSVRVLGDDIFTDEELEKYVSIAAGEIFSQKKLVETITTLKNAWGHKGYIYADVYPDIRPDEENKLVDITFRAERGQKMYVNRVDITGNRYTRDKVIRRELTFEEGDLITSDDLSNSKSNVEFLSYFERGGINWKIHRLTEDLADLELNVQETKTGQFSFNMTLGTDKNSARRSLKGALQLSKKNLFGRGWDTQAMVQGDRSGFRRFNFSIFDPYLFDTNISGGIDAYIKHESYDQWTSLNRIPNEDLFGGTARVGFLLPSIDKRLQLFLVAGIENINNNSPMATGSDAFFLQPIVRRSFQDGTLVWFSSDLIMDTRNHKIYPTQGYRIYWSTKVAPSGFSDNFGMIKSELEASWYMGLIGDADLVLGIRAKGGIVRGTSDNKVIPYRELFHVGGQTTVRGFVWGSIEPAFAGNPIGARNMVLFNVELTFPILADYSMKAHVFYDAGAGWDTPKNDIPDRTLLRRDKFNLRHAIGFGINLMQPQPIKIDWGYKLDRDRAAGESPSEWHIAMNVAW